MTTDRRTTLEALRALLDAEIARLGPTEPAPTEPPAYMTVEEYAERVRLTPATVRRMVRDEHLPHVRPRPRRIRIKVAEADAFIAARTRSPISPRTAAHRGSIQ